MDSINQNTSAPANSQGSDDTQKSIDETLKFLNTDILELMGAENMTEEEKNQIYQKMMQTIQNRVLARVVDSLSEDQYSELKELLEKNNEEGFAVLAQEAGFDLPQLFSEEALLYKIEMVNLIKNSNTGGEAN